MVKILKTVPTYGLIAIGLVLCAAIAYGIHWYALRFHPSVTSIHYINLDKDVDRQKHMEEHTRRLNMVERWPAVYGKDIPIDDMVKMGIGYAMVYSGQGNYAEQRKNTRNLGTVGCYLSHRTLLEHLASRNVPDYYGHLILEDDVQVPDDFLLPGDRWHAIHKTVPMDWDMVYFDISEPKGFLVAPGIMKLQHESGVTMGNWGTHAYLVRHGAIRSKILPWLKYMNDAVDQQYDRKFNEWNVYAIVPGIIKLNEAQSADSSIQKKE